MDNPEIEETPIDALNSERNLNENQDQSRQRVSRDRDNHIVINELLKWLQLGIVYAITFLCLILWSYRYVPIQIPLIPLILSDCKNIFLSSFFLYRSEGSQKRVHLKSIIENVGTFLSKICLLLSFSYVNFRTSYLLIPLFLSTITNLLIKSISFNTCQTISEIMFIIFRIARLLTAISITLKIDKIYDFSWSLSLWPVWSFLGVLGILTIGLTIYTIGAFCTYKSQENSKLELWSSCWLLCTCIGLLFVTTLFCISVANGTMEFLPPVIFFVVFVLVTVFSFKSLVKGLSEFLFGDRDPSMPTVLSNEILPVQTEQQATSFTRKIRNVLKTPPKSLIQLSSSYFKRASADSTPKKRICTLIVPSTQRSIDRRCITVTPKKDRFPVYPDTNPNTYEVDKCFTCSDRYANAVLLECGHGGICYSCAQKLEHDTGICHICRSPISNIVKVLKLPGGILDVISEDI